MKLGGFITFWDFAQLPPVADRPLCSKSYNIMPGPILNGFSVYQIFSSVVILQQVLGTDSHIHGLLMWVCDGTPTHDDWKTL